MYKKFLIKFLTLLIFISGYLFPQQFKFAWLSDIHIGYPTAKEDLIRSVNDINTFDDINFTIISGDITAVGSLKELSEAKSILDNLKKPYYIIPGNHDTKWSESGGIDFIRLWGKDRFVFEYDKFLFIGLHEGPRMKMADGFFAPEDLRWYDSLITSLPNSNQPIFFVTHYPLDESIANWYEMVDRLKNVNIQLVLFGHGHTNKIYDFESIKGVMGRSNLRAKEQIGGYTIAEIKNDSIFFSERITGYETKLPWLSLALQQRNFEAPLFQEKRPDYSVNTLFPNVKTFWQQNMGWTIASSAVVDDNSVYFGDASGFFYSLNKSDGRINWKYKTRSAIYSSGDLSCDWVVFGSTDSSIYCLNKNDGKLSWNYKTNASVLGSPLIEDGKVYIGCSDNKFRKFDLETGKLVWEFNGLNGFVETKPVLYDDKIFFGAWDEFLYCLNSESGNLIWKWKGDKPGVFYSPAACIPVVSSDIIFIAAPDRKLTAIDIETGKEFWRTGKYQVRETLGLSESEDKLFIRTLNDTIMALMVSKAPEGPIWITDCNFGYDISSAQIVEKDSSLFYATKNGLIFCLDSETGKIKWQHKITNGFVNTITALSSNEIITTDFEGNVRLIQSAE